MKMNTNKAKRGFTLIEILVTLAVYTIAMAAILGILVPALNWTARLSGYEANTAFLVHIQEVLSEKMQNAAYIRVWDTSPPADLNSFGTDYDLITPANGLYNINHEIFNRRLFEGPNEGRYITSRIKPNTDVDLIMHMEEIGNRAVMVTLILERFGDEINRAVFAVRTSNNADLWFYIDNPNDIGSQSIQIIYD
jgi:prepilin-type N-terminal cleavage/methylation domain-containing protein